MKTGIRIAALFAASGALALLAVCCAQRAGNRAENTAPAERAGAELSDAELSRMSPHELAQYIFAHNNCSSCHTLGAQGQLGYTAHGLQVRQESEGCVDLLTAVQKIAPKPQSEWTPQERMTVEHFNEYGCTACHQIEGGKLVPTPWGAKLAAWHMSCPEIIHLLSSSAR